MILGQLNTDDMGSSPAWGIDVSLTFAVFCEIWDNIPYWPPMWGPLSSMWMWFRKALDEPMTQRH